MASSSDQCAVAEDGSLLDASKITFYDDVDDDTPLPNSASQSKSITTSDNLHPFFRGGKAPSSIVAGSRRSGRVTRPSVRVTDPNNLETSISRKRSATVTATIEGSVRAARRAKHALHVDETEDVSEGELGNSGYQLEVGFDAENDDDGEAGMVDATTDDEGEEDSSDIEQAEEEYHRTKGMGDSDRKVCLIFSHKEYYLTSVCLVVPR
jgi:hypothetical protein